VWVALGGLRSAFIRKADPIKICYSTSCDDAIADISGRAEGHPRAVGYFLSERWLKDGAKVAFLCADVFNFNPSTGQNESMIILYDTHPIRALVGDKYT
jgi:hypothetical protein